MGEYLLQGLLLGLYAGVSPGPLQTLQFSLSLKNGWRKTIYLALTPLFSDLPILILFMTLFSKFSENVLHIIHLIGGVVILYLAYHTYKSFSKELSPHPEGVEDEYSHLANEPKLKMLFSSVMLNWVNPNVYIFWGTIGAPIALKGLALSKLNMLAFVLTFYIFLISMLAFMIYLFSKSKLLSPNFQKGLGIALSILLLGMGSYNIFLGLQHFVL